MFDSIKNGVKKVFQPFEDASAYDNARMYIFDEQHSFQPQSARGSNRISVDGFITSEISIGGGNEYTTPMEDISFVQKALQTISVARTVANASVGTSMPQNSVLSRTQTAMFYKGARKPTFSVNMVFIAMNGSAAKYDVIKKVEQVYKGVFPTVQKNSSGEVLNAPLGYTPFAGGFTNATGTIALKIGNWFYANGLVMTNADFTFSKEVVECGKPLYASGVVSFEPYRVISYDEFMRFFLR